MKILVILIFALAYAGVSCTPPGSSTLGSESTNRDDDDDSDDEDRRDTRRCSERDSCQDICDDMFEHTTEQYDCYELTAGEVSTISKVWDEFSNNEVSSSELEDLDPEDVKAYLDVGFESFVDLVKGEEIGYNKEKWASGDIKENSKKIMKWIAEEKDIAEVILEQDSNFVLGMELFVSVSKGVLLPSSSVQIASDSSATCNSININRNSSKSNDIDDITCNNNTKLFELEDFSGAGEFLKGFTDTDISSGDSFMTFSADERNETAFEWGHKTLLEFCKEGTDEPESEVEVKTCLQTAYCIYRQKESGSRPSEGFEGVFKDLNKYEDIVGETDEEYCDDLDDEDDMERLFE